MRCKRSHDVGLVYWTFLPWQCQLMMRCLSRKIAMGYNCKISARKVMPVHGILVLSRPESCLLVRCLLIWAQHASVDVLHVCCRAWGTVQLHHSILNPFTKVSPINMTWCASTFTPSWTPYQHRRVHSCCWNRWWTCPTCWYGVTGPSTGKSGAGAMVGGEWSWLWLLSAITAPSQSLQHQARPMLLAQVSYSGSQHNTHCRLPKLPGIAQRETSSRRSNISQLYHHHNSSNYQQLTAPTQGRYSAFTFFFILLSFCGCRII